MTDDVDPDAGCQDLERCQGHPGDASVRAVAGPVDPLDTEAAKKRVAYLLLQESPAGVPLPWLARGAFGDHVESGDADWKWVRRECERQGHTVEHPTQPDAARTEDGKWENQEVEAELVWVYPTFKPGKGVLDSTVSGSSLPGECSGTDESEAVAVTNAAGILKRNQILETAEEWGVLVGALSGKRAGEEKGAEKPTRFNDVERARQGPNRTAMAFSGASAESRREGVVVTPTTDPERFDSIGDAAADLVGDVRLLRRWLDWPPGVTVVDPTATGIPHAHVALFVAPEVLPSRHDLHNYWHTCRGRAFEVGTDPIVATDDGDTWTWRWADGEPADADGCPPPTYLRQGPMALVQTARLDAEDVLAVAAAYRERGDAPMNPNTVDDVDAAVSAETGVDAKAVRWAAWYFGTDLQPATRPSKVLRKATEAGDSGGAADG